jgi:hypothetical protein
MNTETTTYPDPATVEGRVIQQIAERRAKGVAKYGVSMERSDLSRKQWLQHALEEALDLAIYLQKCIDHENADRPTLQAGSAEKAVPDEVGQCQPLEIHGNLPKEFQSRGWDGANFGKTDITSQLATWK